MVYGDLHTRNELQRRKEEAAVALTELQVWEKRREKAKAEGFLGWINISVPVATLIVGIMGFLGSAVGVYLQQGNQLEIKNREFESQLVLSALKEGSTQNSLERLRFLIDAGYLPDPTGAIRAMTLSGKYGSDQVLPTGPTTLSAIVTHDTEVILRQIIKLSGVNSEKPIILVAKDDLSMPGIVAAASARDGKYYIIYEKAEVIKVVLDKANNWRVVLVLGHELAHIALGHLEGGFRGFEVMKENELAADRFAGCVLRLLGAPLTEAEKSFDFLPDNSHEGSYYPPKVDRSAAVVAGWKAASSGSCSSPM